MTRSSRIAVITAAASLAAASAAPVCRAEFVTPDPFGWSRGAPASTYAEWNIFQSPGGPNPPDVGQFPSPPPPGWPPHNVAETTGSAFITGGGNIYSFSAPTAFDVGAPGYGLGPAWRTTVLMQVRTLGSEVDHASVRLGDLSPAERVELGREPLGGFGGFLVDTLYRFEVPENPAGYVVRFSAAASSMSLDRVALDAIARCVADFNADGFVDFFDYDDFVTAFEGGAGTADFNRDGFVDFFDYDDFVGAFEAGC
jgi:hypothetical protein